VLYRQFLLEILIDRSFQYSKREVWFGGKGQCKKAVGLLRECVSFIGGNYD